MGKGKKGNAGASGGSGAGGASGFSAIDVDPRRVRYAHSKIKPVFSGCGRTIEQTLEDIRDGKTLPSDLPPITVLFGPADAVDGGPCYFSLNNRRLFVLKACREEGLLGADGLVHVRARPMKPHECERYTVDRCSLQAKFLFAPKPSATGIRLDVAGADRRPPGRESRETGSRDSPPDPEISGYEVLEYAQEREDYGSTRGETGALRAENPETPGACDGRAGGGRSKTRGASDGGSNGGRRNRREETGNEGVAVAGENTGLGIGGIEMSRKFERSRKGRRRKAGAEGTDT